MKKYTILMTFFLLIAISSCKSDTKKDTAKETQKTQQVQDSIYKATGLKYAMSTKATLGKNLMGAIQKKGTEHALEFCNTKAIPLTDSMAMAQKAIIKRVSDKPRNPDNQANAEELGYIKTFKEQLAAGQQPEGIVKKKDGKVHFYYPIATNQMCLQCHGTPNEQIKPQVMTMIDKLYPEDKAKGYAINEVRGIWNVVFDEGE
ncbi:DUF3365 domain-containing protein [Aureibaculum sp. A20]|uniref:DUF3365 domain-containing protein n=1 Tax=Aureibaculum flavum TaxID=2795986 RepID=A0ABS0WRS0_9FLAO|nr:DUF3365 domain-containing protein [Aureibaculum flavum]MBJ2174690.1 DUF3365 domain-containing protein [Aureibaculum flavum]